MKVINSIRLEGNNGGDYFLIQQLSDGRLHLEVGHCCVIIFDSVIPVEVFTLLINQAMISSGSLKKLLSVWDGNFKKELLNKCESTFIFDSENKI